MAPRCNLSVLVDHDLSVCDRYDFSPGTRAGFLTDPL